MESYLTSPIYYYDDNGYKIGPIRKRELIALAERGAINPETRVTNDNIEVKAKQIPKLKFIEPELRRAEELFNFENVNLKNLQTRVYPSEMATDVPSKPVTKNNAYQENMTIPVRAESWYYCFLSINAKYWYLNLILKLYYLAATIIFYGGLILTMLIALVCIFISPLLSLIILLAGTILSIIGALGLGITADLIQWMFDIEKHLAEIKKE